MVRESQEKNRTEFEKSFRARLTAIRTTLCGERGQAEFARKLGLDPAQYYPYEEKSMPPLYVIKRMLEAGVDPYELFGVERTPGQIAEALQPYLTKAVREIEREKEKK